MAKKLKKKATKKKATKKKVVKTANDAITKMYKGEMKDIKEEIKYSKQNIADYNKRIKSMEGNIARENRDIGRLEKQLDKVAKKMKDAEPINFKEGQACVHKKFGNVLINKFIVNQSGNIEAYLITVNGARPRVTLTSLVAFKDTTAAIFG